MKEVLVSLSARHREQLLSSVAEHSEVSNALHRAIRLDRWAIATDKTEYIVICDQVGAEALLHAAGRHCPEAVARIQSAIDEGRAALPTIGPLQRS
jgi:hypothetical protein